MSTDPHDAERDAVRQRLYELFDGMGTPIDTKRQRALELGCVYLGVTNGHIQRRTDDGTDEVVASAGENPDLFPEGAVLDRATTYCRRTVESHSPLALSNVPEQGWAEDPAYAEHDIDCYLDGMGQRVTVELIGIERNPSIDFERFDFEPPEGVDVMQGA